MSTLELKQVAGQEMRFARRLISHLTPEWRNHYIHYDELKVKIYEMVDKTEQPVSSDNKQETEGIKLLFCV